MSFYRYKDTIEEGDLVLAFVSRTQIKPFTVTKGEWLNTRYGNFEHDKMVGLKYGTQMGGAKERGFVHLLHPSAELWTVSLPHRTQIVYTPDSSYIVQRLGITSGSRVIEAGTGSASFTHAFARTVGEKGRLFTYEFHEPRFLEAREELTQHGLTQVNTTITHRDVCNDGFDIANLPQEISKDGDIASEAIFLDLPSPWTAIPHLKSVIAQDRRVGICCFSPCIEQVDKTIEALEENGWTSIELVEIAGRRWEARKEMVRDLHDVVKRLKDIQGRKTLGIESRRMAELQNDTKTNSQEAESPKNETSQAKRSIAQVDSEASELPEPKNKGFNPFGKGLRIKEGEGPYQWKEVTKIEPEIKTHTSYLTFAYMVPSTRQAVASSSEDAEHFPTEGH